MSERSTDQLNVVTAWLEAVNTRDAARLLELSSTDIAIIGPRGRSMGHAALAQWLAVAGLSLTSLRFFQKGDTLVVEQQAVWDSTAAPHENSSIKVACRFLVKDRLVAEIERMDSLPAALTSGGLSQSDEVRLMK